MYTILVTQNNELVVSQKERIMQRSKLVDNLHFLVEPIYKNIQMDGFTATLEYLLPISREYKTENLVLEPTLYKNMLEYKLPFDTNLTKEPGKIEVQLTFTRVEMDAEGQVKQMVRKTSPCKIDIIPISAWSDIIADSSLSALDQRLVQLDLLASQLSDMGQYIFENKADNIIYNESDSTIQLTANGSPIGNKVTISASGMNAIQKILLDKDGNLVAIYTDESEEVIGKVNGTDCVGVYVPSLVEPDKLTFTLQKEPNASQIVVDIDRTNEWGTPDNMGVTSYVWEQL